MIGENIYISKPEGRGRFYFSKLSGRGILVVIACRTTRVRGTLWKQ